MFESFADPLPTRHWPVAVRYGATVLAVLLAAGVEWALWRQMAGHPFLIFFAPVILSAALFDRGSGILAALLGAVVLDFLFLEPHYSLRVAGAREALALALFAGIGLITAILIEAMHKAVHKLHEANRKLVQSENAKDLLLREAAHRMRNDLQMIGAVVELQERAVREPSARSALSATADRIRLLGRVQQRLQRSEEAAVVDAQEFITELCDDLKNAHLGLRPVRLTVAAERHYLPQDRAVAVGLIINELLTNTLKYAFPDDRAGKVEVIFAREGGEYRLSVADDGVGLGSGDAPEGGDEAGGLGQRIVRAMAGQLGGTYEIQPNDATSGTIATVRFSAGP